MSGSLEWKNKRAEVPLGGATGQALVKNSNSDLDTKWSDAAAATNGLPSGGTTEQILSKVDDTDYNAHWVDKPVGGGGTPATTVTSETSFSISPIVGTLDGYAREDHTHGTPPDPVPTHASVTNSVHNFDSSGDAPAQAHDNARHTTSYVAANAGITGATKTKITYDAKGLVTSGADITLTEILVPVVGSPAVITQMNNVLDYEWSAGVLSGGDLTDNANGTVTIAAGEALLRTSASETAPLKSLAFAQLTNASLTDASLNYIYANYNAGTPLLVVTTSISDFNCWDKCHLYTIFRDGNTLYILEARNQNRDANRKQRRRYYETDPFSHVSGGTVLSNSSKKLLVTAGGFYYSLNKLSHDAYDTTVAGTANANVFDYYYSNGAGSWTKVADQKEIDNTNYDDGTGTLHALTIAHYGVHWSYLALDLTPRLIVVYGTADYTLLADAQAASAPASLPPMVGAVGKLIGRCIIQKSNTTVDEVKSAFSTTFSSSGVPNHNDTANKQGGTTGEYYHITSAQATVVQNTSGTNTGDQTVPAKASGTEINTGTDDAKFTTPKAIADSNVAFLSDIPASVTDATIATTDVTTNNASTTKHGWFPKLPTPAGLYFKDDLSVGTPSAALPELVQTKMVSTDNQIVAGGYTSTIELSYEIATGFVTEVGIGAVLAIS